jgi:predicted aspartyl protease
VTLSKSTLDLIQYGPIAEVEVRHHPAANLRDEVTEWGEPSSVTVPFLVDTGAPQSVIDGRVAEQIGLVPMSNLGAIKTATGSREELPLYRLELVKVLKSRRLAMPLTVLGIVSDALWSKARYRGILGRDWLQKTRFVYDGAAGTFDIELA